MHLYCLDTQKSQITLFWRLSSFFVFQRFFLCHCSNRRQGRTRVATTDAVGTTVVTAPPDALKGAMTTTLVAFVKPQHAFFVLCCFDFQSSTPPHASQSLCYPSRCPQAWVEAKTGSWSPCHEPGPWSPTRSFRQRRQKEKLCCQQWGIWRPRCGSLHDRDILRRVNLPSHRYNCLLKCSLLAQM